MDSVSHNVDFASLEMHTKSRIQTIKAYSSVRNKAARLTDENITKVTAKALVNSQEHDDFMHLVLAAPTVDVSKLDTTNMSKNDDTSVLKQRATTSAKNMISVAEAALENKHLRKVVIMEHAPRSDLHVVDPSGFKPKLAKYANSSL